MIRVLLTGDLLGRAGRRVIEERLDDIRNQMSIDFVISNIENAAAGFSITPRIAEELFAAGVDVMTSGNHIFDKKEILDYIETEPRLVRPANYAPGVPGKGRWLGKIKGEPAAVINVMGRVFMPPCDDPFRALDSVLSALPSNVKIILVDVHAETTSEKMAIGRYLDGRVSGVVGTHTHVLTADEQIFPHGTGYITDLGMTGPHDGIIGMKTSIILEKFRLGLSQKLEPSEGNIMLNGVIIDIDEQTGHAHHIERVSIHHS